MILCLAKLSLWDYKKEQKKSNNNNNIINETLLPQPHIMFIYIIINIILLFKYQILFMMSVL